MAWLFSAISLFLATSALAGPLEDVRQAECRLGNCWQDLFPKIQQTVVGSVNAIEAYQSGLKAKMERAALLDSRDGDGEQRLLQYKLAILRHYLEECEELRRDPSASRHLLIVGHHFEKDGENFRLAAMTRYQELLEKTCGTDTASPEFQRCRQSIVVISDTNKRDLLEYLSLLGPGAIRSLDYVGHGIATGLVLGPKDLLLPITWQPELKLTEAEWRKRNLGMLYSSDLDGTLAATLSRVVARGAPLTFFACDTGRDFAPAMKALLPSSEVRAATVGMHFEYLGTNSDGHWTTDWDHPVPRNALQTRLVPNSSGTFGAVAPKPSAAAQEPSHARANPRPPRDAAARDVVLRLALNSAFEAVVDHGKRLIVFSDAERDRVRELVGNRVRDHALTDDLFGYDSINNLLQEAREKSANEPVRELDRRLLDKINDSIAEAVSLYY